MLRFTFSSSYSLLLPSGTLATGLEAPRRIPVSHVSSLFPQFRHLPVAGNIVLVRSLPDWRWRCRFPRFCVSPCFLSDSWSQTPVVDVYLFLFILFYCRGTVVCIR